MLGKATIVNPITGSECSVTLDVTELVDNRLSVEIHGSVNVTVGEVAQTHEYVRILCGSGLRISRKPLGMLGGARVIVLAVSGSLCSINDVSGISLATCVALSIALGQPDATGSYLKDWKML